MTGHDKVLLRKLRLLNGRRIQLVQQALAPRTDIPTGDQILMYNGMALDPGKPLSAYGLPVSYDTHFASSGLRSNISDTCTTLLLL